MARFPAHVLRRVELVIRPVLGLRRGVTSGHLLGFGPRVAVIV